MAAAGGRMDPLEEAICSICLDPFQDPVMITSCGHNFCRACITQCQCLCPQCRTRFPPSSLRPNRELGNVVQALLQLKLRSLQDSNPDPRRMCKKHQEVAKLFCLEDKALLCLVCRESRAHKTHSALPIEEAAQEYQYEIENFLKILTDIKEKTLKAKSCHEKKIQQLKRDVGYAWQRIAFRFPKQEAKTLVPLLDTCETKMDQIVDFAERGPCLTKLIGEIEDKCGQTSFAFLQDIGDLLSRCEKEIEKPRPNLNEIIRFVTEQMKLVHTKLAQFPEKPSKPTWIKENVMLDPETAHHRYIVSQDLKSVHWAKSRQDLPYSSKRFEGTRCVLGRKGFTSGKHYWIVDVESEGYWAVGVAQGSVDREEKLDIEPDSGIWALARYNDQYKGLTSPPTLLDLNYYPVEIRVYLNYDDGTVDFYDEDMTRLFIFQSIDFQGDEVFPFFRIFKPSSSLRLC
ncbi:LOW QUALITY PROTEIN: E3 ubiquitin-protein ligase TRIM39-like [Sceloporus undulatus]|uniref:LOW QUALITY PROTEIN: E3 ubiquitin-protein ligase TRIM39-like n=1 Tax=Sceloporus undulatus TaxID=8520 RepID=UPI001C4C6E88|nr:LOW QUALITY PROTEIN: E3 ubiquitin-protein ligase TRIM39-like [Sceloporus undulatus]